MRHLILALLIGGCSAHAVMQPPLEQPGHPSALTLPFCMEDEYDISYYAVSPDEDPELCEVTLFVCDKEGEKPFFDDCGCGCYFEKWTI